jgi:hypothetical protein
MKKSIFLVILVSLFLTVSVGQSNASISDAKASLDVNSIVSILNTTWNATIVNGTAALAQDFSNSASDGFNFGTGVSSATATLSNPYGNASATATIGSNNLLTTVSHADNAYSASTASQAITGQVGQTVTTTYAFVYTGSTASPTYHISIPYDVYFNLAASPGTYSSAYGNATVSFYFTTTSPNRNIPPPDAQGNLQHTITQEKQVSIETEVINGASLINNTNGGTFTFDLKLYPGDKGEFSFNTLAASSATVPLPAAVWLLGSGILGLIGIRRKL